MVTSQKAFEKNVENRGSKSDCKWSVKEQRVYGSWHVIISRCLRYTLTGFERNNQTKFLSNQITQKRLYSSIPSQGSESTLHPWCITGFVDGEGSFIVRVREDSRYKVGWIIEPIFSISLGNKDLQVLKDIKTSFDGIGSITKDGDTKFKYKVQSLEQITKVIIPHFECYPLLTQKLADYILFKEIIDMMNNKEHLTSKGLENIVSIKASINKGLPTNLKAKFSELNPVSRPIVKDKKIPHGQWIAGFTSGEGYFKVTICKSITSKLGFRVLISFIVTQHDRDLQLMESLISYFGCGKIEKDSRGPYVYFVINKYMENYKIIIPFFKEHKIIGKKLKDFQDWCKVAEIINTKDHLTISGVDMIKDIKSRMNKGRV